MSMRKRPDLLCIGMQKAGTETLHNIMSIDSRFWIPVVKEFHHFDGKNAHKHHGRHRKTWDALREGGQALVQVNTIRKRKGLRPVDDLDRVFAERSSTYLGNGKTDELYLEMFSVAPEERITADVTPGYSELHEDDIRRVRFLLPDARIFLIIRDPVARAWSKINMDVRKKLGLSHPAFDAVAADAMRREIVDGRHLKRLLEKRDIKMFPTRIHAAWSSVYGRSAVLVLGFDRFVRNPAGALDAIHAFATGADADSVSLSGETTANEAPAPNRKAKAPRVEMDRKARAELVSYFEDEMRASERAFGEKAEGWLARYGLVSASDAPNS